METRRDREKETTKKTEEDRWRELYPEIKKCVIVIARLRLDRANMKLKQVKDGDRISVGGRRGRSAEPSPDWMEPVELDDSDCGFRSFVKKVKVRVRGSCTAANGSRRPRGRPRGAGLLRLGCQSCDVTADPVDLTDPAHHCCAPRSTRLMERWRRIRRNDKQISVNISQSEANYNYSLHSKVPDSPDTPNGQSQDASPSSCCDHTDGGWCSCSTEKENPPSIVFKKEVKRRRWRRRWGRRKVKREPEDDSWTPPLVKKVKKVEETAKQKTNPPERRRRWQACRRCAACLRKDCGKCLYCLDKRKFGGPQKKKQRCLLRVCRERRFRPRPPQANLTVTTATEPQHPQRKRGRDEEEEEEVKVAKTRTRGRRWGGGRATPRWMKEESGGGENSPSAQEGSVLIVSPDLPRPLLLQPKEEEEAVEIMREAAEGGLREDGRRAEETAGWAEKDECSEVVTESGTYYEVEVEVPGSESDEETLTASLTPSESLGLFSLFGGGAMDDVTCGRGLFRLLMALRRTVLPAHWVSVLAAGPVLQLLQCSKLSSMSDTIVHVRPDHSFYITVQSRLLPDTHTLYTTHTPRITHLSQLVSLLLELEQLTVCRGLRVRSPTCHVLVAPPCLTCLPCLLQEEEEKEEKEVKEVQGRMN